MARKLFALEDLEAQVGDVAELETTPEEGEVADVQVETAEEIAEIAESEAAIVEGGEAAAQLEEVEAVVEKAVEEEDGLTPAGAEAVKVAVEAICARIGANPKAMHALYATENFVSKSSRKANSQYALEGIGEFLKDLWKRIKARLSGLWEKVKAFFENHVSSIGRVKKALEAMKVKVSDSSGKFKGNSYLDVAPSGLVEAFASSSDISAGVVATYINTHRDQSAEFLKIEKITTSFTDGLADFKADNAVKTLEATRIKSTELKGDGILLALSTQDKPLIGGVAIKAVFKFEEDGSLDVDIERDKLDNAETKLGVSLADKQTIQKHLTDTLAIIKDSVKYKERFHKRAESFNKIVNALNKGVDAMATAEEQDKEAVKAARALIKGFNKLGAKVPALEAELVSLNVKLAKAVLSYAGLCLKNYK